MLNNFKWYRKLRGGVWYKVVENSYTYDETINEALPEDNIFWIRNVSKSFIEKLYNIIKTENYDVK
jgi:hypothetical protein